MGKTASFFGHADLEGKSTQISPKLRQIIISLIKRGVDTFYVGNHGEFDILSSKIICDLQTLYPEIKVIAILCYPNELQYLKCDFTDFLMPSEIAVCPRRACIVQRNHWVVDHSDFIVCFVRYETGGAYSVLLYAQKHHKQIIKLS